MPLGFRVENITFNGDNPKNILKAGNYYGKNFE